MRRILILLLAFGLKAEDALPQRLQRAPRLSLAALQTLHADLAQSAGTPWKPYWQSLVDYHLAWKLRGRDAAGAKAILEAAITRLKDAQTPDSKALLGGCLDLMIGFNRAKAIVYAPQAARLIQEAGREAPGNPRVKVFWGIHCVFIPALFGGGSARAITTLTEAIQNAEAEGEAGDPGLPRWGRIEALVWLVQAQADDGKEADARRTVAQAVALDPGYPFARALQRELR